jgi:hypothetical protein
MSNVDNSVGDTGSGFIAGVQPAQPRMAADWAQSSQTPAQQVSQPIQVVPQQPNGQPAARWTDEDLERARQQEKDKLYGRIEQLDSQMRTFQEAREQEQAERDRLAAEAEEARRLKEEGELEIRDLLARRETEWKQQLGDLERRYDNDRAVFAKEREFMQVQEYRRDRLEQEQENILPELREFVTGDTIEAIDASIEVVKARTEQIFVNLAQANQQLAPFQQPRGAAPTAPPVGPMEQMPTYETLTPEDIKGMDMETYKKYRGQLLQATNPQNRRMR